ncbi:MAG: hypothetical protein WCO52_02070 [bacterium]
MKHNQELGPYSNIALRAHVAGAISEQVKEENGELLDEAFWHMHEKLSKKLLAPMIRLLCTPTEEGLLRRYYGIGQPRQKFTEIAKNWGVKHPATLVKAVDTICARLRHYYDATPRRKACKNGGAPKNLDVAPMTVAVGRISLQELPFSTPTYNFLLDQDCVCLGLIARLTRDKIVSRKHQRKKCLEEIEQVLCQHELRLATYR